MCIEEACTSLGNAGRGRRNLTNKKCSEIFTYQEVEVIRHRGRTCIYLESGLFKT